MVKIYLLVSVRMLIPFSIGWLRTKQFIFNTEFNHIPEPIGTLKTVTQKS